jgi:hypothetical protein
MDLRTFVPETARAFSTDVDNTHVSGEYVRAGIIDVLYDLILLFHESRKTFLEKGKAIPVTRRGEP